MGNYQIVWGDTLSQIVQKKYGLKGWTNIEKACWEVAKLNGIKDINKIYAGKSLELPDSIFADAKAAPAAQASAPKTASMPAQKPEILTKVEPKTITTEGTKLPEPSLPVKAETVPIQAIPPAQPEKSKPVEAVKSAEAAPVFSTNKAPVEATKPEVESKEYVPAKISIFASPLSAWAFNENAKKDNAKSFELFSEKDKIATAIKGKDTLAGYAQSLLNRAEAEIASTDKNHDFQMEPDEQIELDKIALGKANQPQNFDSLVSVYDRAERKNKFMDLNGDGSVSRFEYAAYLYAMEANNESGVADGNLTVEEYQKTQAYFDEKPSKDAKKFRKLMESCYKALENYLELKKK